MSGVFDVETAATEMRMVAAANSRCRDPVHHVIVSLPDGERLTDDQVDTTARRLLGALGWREHQWLAAVHADTGNFHIHLVVNRVNPQSRRAHYPQGDWLTMDKACRELHSH